MSWQNNKKIAILFAYGPQNRNAWVYVVDLGWRKLWPEQDSQIVAMIAMATHAKSRNRPTKFYEEGNKIKILYVL